MNVAVETGRGLSPEALRVRRGMIAASHQRLVARERAELEALLDARSRFHADPEGDDDVCEGDTLDFGGAL